MRITEIEYMTKHKMRVFLDGEPAFVFTDRERDEWQLHEGDELIGDKEQELLAYVSRMAARTAMNLLLQRDYSEAELYKKLLEKGFMPDAAAAGIVYVQSYHYLDDARYVAQYIASRRGTASRRMIMYKLKQKGVSDDIISSAMDEAEWDDTEGIRGELRKRFGAEAELSELADKDREKFIRSLVRKGYHYSDIITAMKAYGE